MRGFRGVVAGVLVLTFLEATLRTPAAAGRVGGFFTGFAKAVDHIVNPAVPLIPDFRDRPTAATSSSGTGTARLSGSQFTPAVTTRPSVPSIT